MYATKALNSAVKMGPIHSEGEISKFELEDEVLSKDEVLRLLVLGFIGLIFLVFLTTVCIWSKDFRRDSTFSPMSGKMESTK